MDWTTLDFSSVDTPALIIDQDKVAFNIDQAIQYAGGLHRLRPHVKTHKMLEVAKMQMAAGIKKFKCATIAEAEMLGMAGAADVLIAYQPQGPKILRVKKLIDLFPNTHFSVLIDNPATAQEAGALFDKTHPLSVYIDVNDGQNRTGIKPGFVLELADQLGKIEALTLVGLHCYDGHIRMPDLETRISATTAAFAAVISLRDELSQKTGKALNMVAGGSPSFSAHARYHDVECSPGTFVFWDERYANDYEELPFKKAAVVATRVISKIDPNTYCLDLGHKSIASEFPFPRVKLMTSFDLKQISHSEEHLVIQCRTPDALKVGQLLLGYPYHICPTVALYDQVHVLKNGTLADKWNVIARNRSITI